MLNALKPTGLGVISELVCYMDQWGFLEFILSFDGVEVVFIDLLVI